VQRIGWILAVLLAIGWLASEFPVQNACSNVRPNTQTCWRRTVDGWENSSQWCFYYQTREPAFHPIYVIVIQSLVVCLVIACHTTKCFSNDK